VLSQCSNVCHSQSTSKAAQAWELHRRLPHAVAMSCVLTTLREARTPCRAALPRRLYRYYAGKMQSMQQWSGVDCTALRKRLLVACRAERKGDVCSAAEAVERARQSLVGRAGCMKVLQRVPSRQACKPVGLAASRATPLVDQGACTGRWPSQRSGLIPAGGSGRHLHPSISSLTPLLGAASKCCRAWRSLFCRKGMSRARQAGIAC
jgi:hypothetical protein